MSEQPEDLVVYEDNQGPEAVGMTGPAHSDDGVNPGDEEGDEDGVA